MKNKYLILPLLLFSILFISCNKDDDEEKDNISPEISIQSPQAGLTFSTDDTPNPLTPGHINEVKLKAQATDDGGLKNMKAVVFNSNGNEVFGETQNSYGFSPRTEQTFVVDFFTTTAGNYTVVFYATDEAGNVTSTNPRSFTYADE